MIASCIYTLLKVSHEGTKEDNSAQESKRQRIRFLPSNICDAIRVFKCSDFVVELLGSKIKDSFTKQKSIVAGRCPRGIVKKLKLAR